MQINTSLVARTFSAFLAHHFDKVGK
jgi:hypothetical protein